MANNGIFELLGVVFSSTAVSIFVVSILLKYWIKARLEQSIKHEYDKHLKSLNLKLENVNSRL